MLKQLTLAVMTLSLMSCASSTMKAEKKELLLDTRISESIFLDPVDPEQQVIYIQVRNTSKGKALSARHLKADISAQMQAMGYKVTNRVSEANFMLQANVRNYTEKRKAADGSGESLIGAVVGGVLGAAIGDGHGQQIATTLGAVAGGAAAKSMANKIVDVTFTAEVDIVVAERSQDGQINYRNQQRMSKGQGTRISSDFNNKSDWKKYRTKLVSKANKVNLLEAEATPAILADITQSLSGLF